MKKLFFTLLWSAISVGVFANTSSELKNTTDKETISETTISTKNSTIQAPLVMTCFSASCVTVCRAGGPSSTAETVKYLQALDRYCKSR